MVAPAAKFAIEEGKFRRKKKQREKEVALIRIDVRILTKHHIVPHSEDTTA
jgi:hypothetical protein